MRSEKWRKRRTREDDERRKVRIGSNKIRLNAMITHYEKTGRQHCIHNFMFYVSLSMLIQSSGFLGMPFQHQANVCCVVHCENLSDIHHACHKQSWHRYPLEVTILSLLIAKSPKMCT